MAEQRKIEDERRANNKTIELQKQGFITPIQISDFEIQKSIDSDDKIVDLQTYLSIILYFEKSRRSDSMICFSVCSVKIQH